MRPYKAKLNPFTGDLQLVPTNIILAFKTGVATQPDLPLTGNAWGDSRIANDTGHLYVWSIEASSGLITDWMDAGDIVDLNWSAISGKPSSAVADIDDAVSKRHSQGTDQKLDEGGANEVSVADVKDAVDKKHASGSDNQIAETVPTEDSGISVQDALNTLESDKVDKVTGSSLVPDTEISKIHTQNTDLYLSTAVTNKLYVDGKRGDTYTENGSITKPFKTIQGAINAVSGESATNQFLIDIAPGVYTENLILKSYIILRGALDSKITASTGDTITASSKTGIWLVNLVVDNTGSGAKFNFTSSNIDFLDCYTPASVSGTGGGFIISGGVTNFRGGAFGTLSGTVVSLSGGAQMTPVATSFYSYNGDCLISVASYPILMNVALASGAGKKDLNADATSAVYWGIVVCDMTKVTYTTRLAILGDILSKGSLEVSGTIKSGSSIIINGTTGKLTCSLTNLLLDVNGGTRLTMSKNVMQFDGEAGVYARIIANNNTASEFQCLAGTVGANFASASAGYSVIGTTTSHLFAIIVNSLGLMYFYPDRSVTINEYNLTVGQMPTLKIYGYPSGSSLRYGTIGFDAYNNFYITTSNATSIIAFLDRNVSLLANSTTFLNLGITNYHANGDVGIQLTSGNSTSRLNIQTYYLYGGYSLIDQSIGESLILGVGGISFIRMDKSTLETSMWKYGLVVGNTPVLKIYGFPTGRLIRNLKCGFFGANAHNFNFDIECLEGSPYDGNFTFLKDMWINGKEINIYNNGNFNIYDAGWGVACSITGATGDTVLGGTLKIKAYSQTTEPVLTADDTFAIWKDTSVSGLPDIYIVFRRGTGDQVKVALL